MTDQLNAQLPELLRQLELRLENKIDRRDESMSERLKGHCDRIDSIGRILESLSDDIHKTSSQYLTSICKSQEVMVSQTQQMQQTMQERTEESRSALVRVHERLDAIKSQIGESSDKQGRIETRLHHLERLVFGGGALLAASIAGLAVKALGGH